MSDANADPDKADTNALRTFKYDQVKTLFDYTKFHIGVYLSLGTLLVAAAAGKMPINFRHWLVWLAVLFIGLAGFAGGMIASTLPQCDSLKSFEEMVIGPGDRQWLPGKSWTIFEHRCFWIGIILGALSVLFGPSSSPCLPR
jgi:hypothetical protein